MKKQYLFMTLVLVQATIFSAFANSTRSNYLNSFSGIAVEEMQRSSIPASITLAQGILESAWGQGKLAARSNNHFGIKCKQGWEGPTVPYEDDDYDANGNLIKSCFRAYDNPYDSYRDHTNFLMNRERYASLFELHPMDYIGWAKGLKSCGYATAPDYAERLIRIIEENKLYLYDVNYIKEERTLIAAQTIPQIENNIENPIAMAKDGVGEEDEEYLDIVVPSNVNTSQRQQTLYTEIYTTNQTPVRVETMDVVPMAETPVAVAPVQLTKPIIFRPMKPELNQEYQLQVFAAPRFDISRFIQEQGHMPSSKMPMPVEREQPYQEPMIETVITTERLMNIPQRKNRTQQSKRGISLKSMKLR